MLKRVFSAIFLLMVGIMLLAGCSPKNGNSVVEASLGQEFVLSMGQTATINGEGLSIKFDAVNSDSRCPRGAVCVWAGEAECQLSITYNKSTSRVIYKDTGGVAGSTQDFFNEYNISFKLTPYPQVDKQIASADYKLFMTVTK